MDFFLRRTLRASSDTTILIYFNIKCVRTQAILHVKRGKTQENFQSAHLEVEWGTGSPPFTRAAR